MNIVFPIPVTDLTFTNSNLTEDDYAEWDIATEYNRGDYVISTTTHTIYRSLTDAQTGNDPDIEAAALSDPLIENPATQNWQIMGATNKWKLFDSKPSQPAINAGQIMLEITPGVFIGGISAFNITANTVQIEVFAGPDLLYNRTITLLDESGIDDWLAYFTAPFLPQTEFVVTDLPVLGTPRIVLTFNGTVVRVGQVVMGSRIKIGDTVTPGTGFSGLDFSFVQNDEFGNLTTVEREAVKLSDYSVAVPTPTLQSTYEKLRSLRGGRSAVWVGDSRSNFAAVNYGFLRTFDLVYQTQEVSLLSLEVQGIA